MPASSLPREAVALARQFHAAELAVVRLRFRLGQIAAGFRERPSHKFEPVLALARACGVNESTMYRFAQIASIWSEEEFEELIVGRTAPALSWSHLIELCRVPSRAQRARLTKEARREGLSTREIRRRVRQLLGST